MNWFELGRSTHHLKVNLLRNKTCYEAKLLPSLKDWMNGLKMSHSTVPVIKRKIDQLFNRIIKNLLMHLFHDTRNIGRWGLPRDLSSMKLEEAILHTGRLIGYWTQLCYTKMLLIFSTIGIIDMEIIGRDGGSHHIPSASRDTPVFPEKKNKNPTSVENGIQLHWLYGKNFSVMVCSWLILAHSGKKCSLGRDFINKSNRLTTTATDLSTDVCEPFCCMKNLDYFQWTFYHLFQSRCINFIQNDTMWRKTKDKQ